ADRTARRREDRRIHADDAAVDIKGRSARVAPVDGGGDLQIVDIGAGLVLEIARTRRNDARRRRAAQTERVADRDDPVADARLRLLFERDEGETGAFDLDDGKVGVLVTTDQLALQFAAVAELDADLLGVLDDVVV